MPALDSVRPCYNTQIEIARTHRVSDCFRAVDEFRPHPSPGISNTKGSQNSWLDIQPIARSSSCRRVGCLFRFGLYSADAKYVFGDLGGAGNVNEPFSKPIPDVPDPCTPETFAYTVHQALLQPELSSSLKIQSCNLRVEHCV